MLAATGALADGGASSKLAKVTSSGRGCLSQALRDVQEGRSEWRKRIDAQSAEAWDWPLKSRHLIDEARWWW